MTREQSTGRTSVPRKELDLSGRLALRPKEAAEALGVCEKTLRQIGTEIGRVHRGNVVLYPVEALYEWLRRHTEAPEDAINRIVKDELDALSSDA